MGIINGILIRSANLSTATEVEKNVLREKHHLSRIIDLRTEIEQNEMPDASIENADYLSIPIFDISVVGISHEKSSNVQLSEVIPDMEQLYCKMVTDSSCRKNLGNAARCVMEHDFSKGSVLWHCTEGKDRCGLLSAVLLLALEVKRSTIMEDYLLTNCVIAAKSERYYQMMLATGKSETEAETHSLLINHLGGIAMDKVSGKLTVFFEEPFWVGVFEHIEDGKLSVAKVTFGAEPKDYEVQEYIQKCYYSLQFSPAVATVVKETKRNPKRMQRDAKKQMQENGIDTRSQQALKMQQEQNKQERKLRSRELKEADEQRMFELKQQKKREKHKGIN